MFSPNAFAHLRPSAEKLFEHVLAGVHYPASNPKPIVLLLRFCGRGTPFFNTAVKWKRLADNDAATARSAEDFARLGVAGWKNVLDGDRPAAYTADLGMELFRLLIAENRTEIVVDALEVARNPDNFTDAPTPEGVELGKK